ncbi:ankyrin repeat domain-containing protein 7-like [Acanthaster planci]|uniref:Ankyrin repeat domain-containing protein 7-like n=1 Tax=Acanthaster planci TaxID=133434 RepID=A0A8B7Z8F4_ACAPL|nr:ankyrin repeat domain-containing protein 7-like [Acanthaster planci]
MKKIFKSGKAKVKGPAPAPTADAEFDPPGYSVKEKDLPKLHKSAWGGELAKVQQLSKKGDVNQLDKENRTALHLACAHGHKEVAAFLVSNKAKLNLCDNDQRSPLMKAAQGNHVACLETLLRNKADPNLVDKDGNTALHLGAHGGFVDVVLLLLKGGAMVNAPNKNGSTPLHLCTEAKQDVMAEVLLDNDADVNATNNNNRTALMLACQSDQIGLVKLLLEQKADTEIKDSKGWTANDQAIMGGFHGCSHLIDEANSSRRPRSAVGRPGSSMFGSTGGSVGVGLGFSLGGAGAKDEFDDDEDDLSIGKDSFGDDSWAASASEVDEPVKPKPKVRQNFMPQYLKRCRDGYDSRISAINSLQVPHPPSSLQRQSCQRGQCPFCLLHQPRRQQDPTTGSQACRSHRCHLFPYKGQGLNTRKGSLSQRCLALG